MKVSRAAIYAATSLLITAAVCGLVFAVLAKDQNGPIVVWILVIVPLLSVMVVVAMAVYYCVDKYGSTQTVPAP